MQYYIIIINTFEIIIYNTSTMFLINYYVILLNLKGI